MAADQERADRIRALKQERPDLTWRRIADHVGVTERSATDWQRKGGMEYDNAKKLAELFEVDVDYIWRGTQSDTPSPFAGQDDLADRLDAIEQALAEARSERGRIEEAVSTQAAALREQADVLGELRDAVRDLRETIAAQQTAAKQLEETARTVDRAAQETLERLQAAALPQAAADQTT